MVDRWRSTSIDDSCNVEYGTRVVHKRDGGDVYPVYGGGGATFFMDTANRESRVVISRFGMSAECTRFVNGKFFLNDSGLTLSPKNIKELLPAFLDKFVLAINDQIFGLGKGSAQKNLDVPTFRVQRITYPTAMVDQQRIVALLDEAFDGIATAQANAEKNLKNARALFESHLQSVFSQNGNGWKATTLGAEVDLLVGFAFKSTHYTDADDGITLLRGDNIVQGTLRWDDVKRWSANEASVYAKYQLKKGDVVLAMDRPWVKAGLKRATISVDDLPCLLVQRTACLRSGANLDNNFLMALIGSMAFTRHILGIQTGSGVPHISGQQIKDFEFSRPPLAEQQSIASNLETLRAETQRLESIYQQKLAALAELKKSLLHQAFSGAL